MKYDIKQAVNVKDYEFKGRQKIFADKCNAKKILVTSDLGGNLPKYLKKQISDAGYEYEKIGYTTYVKNVFALYTIYRSHLRTVTADC